MTKKKIVLLPHLLALFGGWLGPLITYILSDNKLKEHSKKALNWQFSLIIYLILSVFLMIIIGPLMGVLTAILLILNLIFCVIATIKASNDELWDYPLSIKFFK